MIKSPKSLISLAAAALTADRRWCLTGTPIQVNTGVDLTVHIIEPILFNPSFHKNVAADK